MLTHKIHMYNVMKTYTMYVATLYVASARYL